MSKDGYLSEEEQIIYRNTIKKLSVTRPFGVSYYELYEKENFMKDMNTCPKCGSLAKTILYSTTTLLAYASTSFDSDGIMVMNKNPNITTHRYRCDSCGEEFNGKQ